MDGSMLIRDRDHIQEARRGKNKFRIVLDYNTIQRDGENYQDTILGPVLPSYPWFVYKKASSLCNMLAPGVIDPPSKNKNTSIISILSLYMW